MDVMKFLAEEVKLIDKAIVSFLGGRMHAKGDVFVDHYYETVKEYILFGGKRLRPFLCIQAFKGLIKNNDDRIYKPSLSVEFLHNASLIHDDIIDRDDTRRGNPAFHYLFRKYYVDHGYDSGDPTHFGTTMGILGGDSTFFLGMEALQDTGFSPELEAKAMIQYVNAFHEICDGVLMEMNFVHLPAITEVQYLKMISLKTAALIEKSLLIGAIFAGADDQVLNLLSRYAVNLGNAFQIKDDLLGSFGDEELTGKPTDGDIRDGKKTLLLLKALDNSDESDRSFLKRVVGGHSITPRDVDRVREIFRESGALNYCEEKLNEYSRLADATIDGLVGIMGDQQRNVLKGLVSFNLGREK